MNLSIKDNYSKLSDLCDQIFDYFNLTIYDFESKIDTKFSIDVIKNKLETFSDKHFKSALIPPPLSNEIFANFFRSSEFMLRFVSKQTLSIRPSSTALALAIFADSITNGIWLAGSPPK